MTGPAAVPPEAPQFRLKLVPLFVTALLAYAVPKAGAYLAHRAIAILSLPVVPGGNLGWFYLQHAGQFVVGLAVIAALKYTVAPADYGLHRPHGKTYVFPAILWGVFFGALMTVVDYAPHFLAHTRPDLGFARTPANIWAWLFFEGVYVGPTEEVPFRALLVTYLATTMPGKLRVGRLEMNWAGILVAFMFALLHASSFDTRAWPQALAQQFYAFALGVLYAYWLEKSRSIVAPIVGHNVSDGVEYLILFAWLGSSP
jgi:uncharacterized protein